MAKSLRWIIVLAVGWEPDEEQAPTFIEEVLEANAQTPEQGFSFVPGSYISEEYIEEIIQTPGILATVNSVSYILEEEQVAEYLQSELATIFTHNEYSIDAHRYFLSNENIEGFIVFLYERPSASNFRPKRTGDGRKMVQQIKGGKRKGLPKVKKSLSPIPRKANSLESSGAPTRSHIDRKMEPTRIAPTPPPITSTRPMPQMSPAPMPPIEDEGYLPLENTQQRSQIKLNDLSQNNSPAAPTASVSVSDPSQQGSEWESFLEELDTEVAQTTENEPTLSRTPPAPPAPTISRSVPPPALTQKRPPAVKKTDMDRAVRPKSSRSQHHIPQMYMNLQEEEKKSSEFSEWEDFLGGLDEEVGFPSSSDEKSSSSLPSQQDTLEYENENEPEEYTDSEEVEEKQSESRIFQGRGLILTPDELALENAIKKHKTVKEDPRTKRKSPTPTPVIMQRPPTPSMPMEPTIQRPGPAIKTPTQSMAPGIAPVSRPPTPLRTHKAPTPFPSYNQMPPQPMQPAPPQPIQPQQLHAVTPQPIVPAHIQEEQEPEKTHKKSFLRKFATVLFILALLGGGGGYGWYINGGDKFMDPLLVKLKKIYKWAYF